MHSATLCWTCSKACGKCPWTERDPVTKKIKFEPVPGWKAIETTLKCHYGWGGPGRRKRKLVIEKSYSVRECPLYEEG